MDTTVPLYRQLLEQDDILEGRYDIHWLERPSGGPGAGRCAPVIRGKPLLPPVTPDLLLRAYSAGVFPMAERRDDPDLFWVDPRRRGVLPLDRFHVSRSLRRRILRGRFGTSVDRGLRRRAAGLRGPSRDLDQRPHRGALPRAVRGGIRPQPEVWEGGELVGGVYGVVLGGAFFGESMFSRRTDASKVALAPSHGPPRERGLRALRHAVRDAAPAVAGRRGDPARGLSAPPARGNSRCRPASMRPIPSPPPRPRRGCLIRRRIAGPTRRSARGRAR